VDVHARATTHTHTHTHTLSLSRHSLSTPLFSLFLSPTQIEHIHKRTHTLSLYLYISALYVLSFSLSARGSQWKQVCTLSGMHERCVYSVAWSSLSEDMFATGAADDGIRIFAKVSFLCSLSLCVCECVSLLNSPSTSLRSSLPPSQQLYLARPLSLSASLTIPRKSTSRASSPPSLM
jgi:WD40 repeat protein